MSIQYMVPGFEPITFGREPLPITTRPGLAPNRAIEVYFWLNGLIQSSSQSNLQKNNFNIFLKRQFFNSQCHRVVGRGGEVGTDSGGDGVGGLVVSVLYS